MFKLEITEGSAKELAMSVQALAQAMLPQSGPAPAKINGKLTMPKEETPSMTADQQPAEQAEEAKETPPTTSITVEDLRAKAAPIGKAGKTKEIKALLTKFEVSSISKLPEEKYAEFDAALEAL